MNIESKLYEGIAGLVIGIAPQNSKELIYTFILQSEANKDAGGVYRHEFDYVSENDELNWFDSGNSSVTGELTPLALQLRSEMGKSTGAKWKNMKFHIDMQRQSFKAEFSY